MLHFFSSLKNHLSIIILQIFFTGPIVGYAQSVPDIETDILVFESTPAGIIASIAAAKSGRQVVMLTAHRHYGGMRISGLSMPNIRNRELFGGLGREFHKRIEQYYITRYGIGSKQVKDCDEGFMFEPNVAEKVFLAWLRESQIQILDEEYIVSVEKKGATIIGVQTNKERKIKAKSYIDASYEGDLMALAGVSYRIGREGRDKYGETLSGLTFPPDKLGLSSDKIQRYVYRLCLTDSIGNQIPIQQPKNYHPATFMIDAAMFASNPPSSLRQVLPLNRLPNRKTDVRVGEGWLGGSQYWPGASLSERALIAREHREYAQGYLWFLLNDRSVPHNVKEELRKWGYAKDEFTDNENWPYQLYIREARRLVGEYVMTEHDILKDRFKPDGVAIGDFHLDVHPIQYVALPKVEDKIRHSYSQGFASEGSVWEAVEPYEISFRAMLPKRNEADNLIVPVCISSSHIAYSSVRMEPVYMMLGHAAGAAAAMSIEQGVNLHLLSTKELRARLIKEGAIIQINHHK